jgi:hypothetical protein
LNRDEDEIMIEEYDDEQIPIINRKYAFTNELFKSLGPTKITPILGESTLG